MTERVGALMRAFCRRTGGNVALTFALASVPLLGAAGAALDYGRLYKVESRTQQAMDAAVLAGTRVLMETGIDAKALKVAKEFFDSTWPAKPTLLTAPSPSRSTMPAMVLRPPATPT